MTQITSISHLKEGFNAYLALQRGLSSNTVESYSRDVDKLLRYIAEEGIELRDVDEPCLEQFVCTLIDLGVVPRTQARIISGVKSFFKYLNMEGYVEKNPTRLLPTPKIGRFLPDVLSVEEIDEMIEMIDMSTPEGIRNHAIIETMYGCGLRVSELIGLRMSQVFADDGYVVVEGKGDKQRLVPISDEALQCIAAYREEVRDHMVVKP
ncbi:MAG: site-specific integrase, partial [Bacteroidales bacterium]|nr:site-specific integrase [Bacteroidales bacterium]